MSVRRHMLLALGVSLALLVAVAPASGMPSTGNATNVSPSTGKVVKAPKNSDAAAQVLAAQGGSAQTGDQKKTPSALQPAPRSSTMGTATPYELDFTLPTAGKSGCMVCHSDPNLIRLRGNKVVSYYLDPAVVADSVHANIMCTGCHVDFAYKAPHDTKGEDWRRTAKLACKNCHKDQFERYGVGMHSIAGTPGKKDPKADKKPVCGDCHGSHDIRKLNAGPTDTPEAQAAAKEGKAALHAKGYEVCGRCHQEWWDGYQDYYHGRAYKTGAADAPACWQCHGWHDVLAAKDKRSTVNEIMLVQTCGQCHPDADEGYVSYSGLVHRHDKVYRSNYVVVLLTNTRQALDGFVETVRSWF